MHVMSLALALILPGHAQAGKAVGDNEDVQAWEGVDPQDGMGCSQALRQQSQHPQLGTDSNRMHCVIMMISFYGLVDSLISGTGGGTTTVE